MCADVYLTLSRWKEQVGKTSSRLLLRSKPPETRQTSERISRLEMPRQNTCKHRHIPGTVTSPDANKSMLKFMVNFMVKNSVQENVDFKLSQTHNKSMPVS